MVSKVLVAYNHAASDCPRTFFTAWLLFFVKPNTCVCTYYYTMESICTFYKFRAGNVNSVTLSNKFTVS